MDTSAAGQILELECGHQVTRAGTRPLTDFRCEQCRQMRRIVRVVKAVAGY